MTDADIEHALQVKDYTRAIRAVHAVALEANARAEEGHALCRAISRDVGHDKDERGPATGLYALLRQPQSVRVSIHEGDAQALGQSITNVDSKHTGNFEGLKPVIAGLQSAIGAEPDRVLGVKGSGLRGQFAQLRWMLLLAVIAGPMVPEIGKPLLKLIAKWFGI